MARIWIMDAQAQSMTSIKSNSNVSIFAPFFCKWQNVRLLYFYFLKSKYTEKSIMYKTYKNCKVMSDVEWFDSSLL